MPYYVFKITQPNPMIKNLDMQQACEAYPEARELARSLRAQQEPGDKAIVKIVFAASLLEAEENLHETREKPILMEWEK
ncbi:MAG: hypothetical protein L3K52_11640 [Candidatus Thiothrix sulfatifontis]|uniref:Uncharacterized protein n=1 Tax=Thiothrix lacustris TaxID=525917 RepID=A0A1Y1QPE6_9GAMM|nr:MAG: hypothetical protein BWK73_20410 [Thiothrix lacustris]UOG90850.1 MAG: hypothetical protein L3K52_11640 [Candidatus Thiothrix sulfatifontis]